MENKEQHIFSKFLFQKLYEFIDLTKHSSIYETIYFTIASQCIFVVSKTGIVKSS